MSTYKNQNFQVSSSVSVSSFMVFACDCLQDDRSPLSDTEEEENCDPEEPSENPEQVLGLYMSSQICNLCTGHADMLCCRNFQLLFHWRFLRLIPHPCKSASFLSLFFL